MGKAHASAVQWLTQLQRLGWLAALSCLLSACAGVRQAPPLAFAHDASFGRPVSVPAAHDLFAMSPAMLAFAKTQLKDLPSSADTRRALLDALYTQGSLKLQYDDSHTRTAAQAFQDRRGNCLSLVLMTASFARHLDLPLSFHEVAAEDGQALRGDLHFTSGHVNLSLQRRPPGTLRGFAEHGDLMVDFLPGRDIARQSLSQISEKTLVAMFYNNRAAELLAEQQPQQAYWWAKAAALQDPYFAPAWNTLGVVYQRSGLLPAAERTFLQVLRSDPRNASSMTNLVLLLRQQGRHAQADELARQVGHDQLRYIAKLENLRGASL